MSLSSEEQMEAYRATCRRRDEAERRRQHKVQQAGRTAAQRVAVYLRETFDVERVVLFGSLVRTEELGPHSDVDLAVAGLSPDEYYQAVARVQRIAGEWTIDLVRLEQCAPSLRIRIDTEGRPL